MCVCVLQQNDPDYLAIRTPVYLGCHCRYRSGIRGHMKAVVMDLLRQYLKVETQFQQGGSGAISGLCLDGVFQSFGNKHGMSK